MAFTLKVSWNSGAMGRVGVLAFKVSTFPGRTIRHSMRSSGVRPAARMFGSRSGAGTSNIQSPLVFRSHFGGRRQALASHACNRAERAPGQDRLLVRVRPHALLAR